MRNLLACCLLVLLASCRVARPTTPTPTCDCAVAPRVQHNMASFYVAAGVPVYSMVEGTVVSIVGRPLRSDANVIIVIYSKLRELRLAYASVQNPLVVEGQHLKAGQQIATALGPGRYGDGWVLVGLMKTRSDVLDMPSFLSLAGCRNSGPQDVVFPIDCK